MLGDSLVRRKRYDAGGAARVRRLASIVGHYSRRARRAAALVRTGVDSPMETRLRLLIVFAGLPEPEVDHRVHDDDGTLLRRYDLTYLPFPPHHRVRRSAARRVGRAVAHRPRSGRGPRRRADPSPGHRVSRHLHDPDGRWPGSRGPCAHRVCRFRHCATSGAATSRAAPGTSRRQPDRVHQHANSARAQLPAAKRREPARQLSPGAAASREAPGTSTPTQPGRSCQPRNAGNQHANSAVAQPERRCARGRRGHRQGGARGGGGSAAGTSRHTQEHDTRRAICPLTANRGGT